MLLEFTKMEGLGNDYVYVDCTKNVLENPGEVAKIVSDRHFGVGADGLILIESSDKADFFMSMYNADGSRGEMCGNGMRCVARFVYDKGLTKKTEFGVDTLAGIKYVSLKVVDGDVKSVTVDMGEPILKGLDIPVTIDKDKVIKEPIEVLGKAYEITCVSMGNPHAVIFIDEDPKDLELEKIGPYFENHAVFPRRVNTEFIQVLPDGSLNMRVWERGSGETLACGTGACASVVAASLCGLIGREATVHLLGGDLHIRWDESDNRVYMEGPAKIVFDGKMNI